MADIIEIADIDKIPKEMLLLGKKTIIRKDCDGKEYEVHGLVGNDLSYVLADGSVVPLKDALANGDIQVSTSVITLANGGTTTVQEIADGLQGVEYKVPDLQTKYDIAKQ